MGVGTGGFTMGSGGSHRHIPTGRGGHAPSRLGILLFDGLQLFLCGLLSCLGLDVQELLNQFIPAELVKVRG